MDNKIQFMIINGDVQYLQNSTMDHREWFISLGGNPADFEQVIRGFIMDNKIVFFKGLNFNYDQQVMNAAIIYSERIKQAMNNQNLEVYCGITISSYGAKCGHGVSKKVNYLITGEKPGPSKVSKAREIGVDIITEDDFLNKFNIPVEVKVAKEKPMKTEDSKYSQEMIDAYNWAFKNGITTMPSIDEADMEGGLTRIAMAKMLSQYAINILGKTPDTSKVVPAFPDVTAQMDADYSNGVTLAYQLGIM